MNYDFKQTNFSRCLLAGLLAGFTAAVLDLILLFCFGSSDIGSEYSFIINPFTLFFGAIIPAVVAGLFYSFLSQMKRGNIIHIIIFSVLTFLFAKESLQINRMEDQNVERLFHQLFMSMIILTGSFATFLVPIITQNKKLQQALF